MKKRLPLLILLFCLVTGFTYAQGIIKGTVTDKKNGDPLPGSTITLKSESTGQKMSTSAGLDGTYIFKNITDGKYEIEAKYISYNDASKSVTVNGNIAVVNLSPEPKSSTLNEVAVTSTASKATDQSAINAVHRSDQILNAVSARTIEVSPDITVANVTQRVSGISIERSNNGEGQYAIIRGMEKRYTYTLINGYKIPSPDNKNRYVPLDIFPADIIDRLEVYKSLTPSMEGDAIAGGINLVLKDAPDDFMMRLNLGAGFSQSVADYGFNKFGNNDKSLRSPRIINGNDYVASIADFSNNGQHFTNSKLPIGTIAGLSIGGRTADKKFGALVSLSYQNIFKDTKGVFFSTEVDAVSNLPKPTSIQSRLYNTQQERSSAVGRFDYKFDGRNKLTLDAAYIDLAQNQYRYVSDTSLTLARTGIGQGRITEQPRSIRNVQKIYNFSLHGDHKLADDLSINWTGVYSKATANENRYELNLVTSRTLQPSGDVVQAPLTVDASNGFAQTFAYNSDQDKSGYLNVIYTPNLFGTKVELSAGGMYRNKTRNSTYDEYTETLPITNSTQVYDGNIDHNTFELASNRQGTPGDALNYDFTENVGAAYGQFKFTVGKLQTLGGVRYEHTSQSWLDAEPVSKDGKTGSIKYYDLLPSVSFKYLLSDKENLRASYYSAISRPNFYEIVPHTSGDPDADYQEVGNTNLKHATADNFDLRYEFFPKPLDQFLVGVFYKNINNPIEYALVSSSSNKDLVLEAGNFGTAHNYGLELDVTKYISHFGFRANYSFTESQITTSKQEAYKDANGNNTIRTVDQTRPLQGQSKHLGNLSLLYKDNKSGLDAQISAVYTGERINSVSQYLNNDVWQKAFVSLDLSAEKRIFKKLFVYGKVTNLLNTPYQLFIKLPYPPLAAPGAAGQAIEYQQAGQNTFVRKDNYQQYYILGLHYKL
ncbi:TonB-dependent receptor [Mucilaginibacter sp. BJC16-A38]|uniref:TonB-dependent receptor n=1 Tax=Mucilaginibacter phenanthrenivorans TaxID=1234842 RepID=UPI0021583DFD|nr:TonB-dependent receptor [Mucilaginibacter phenanthrenivorans]MCR8561927.1 TonB-dependent receptor [Mucilaginibacter phenanthrenivorans]